MKQLVALVILLFGGLSFSSAAQSSECGVFPFDPELLPSAAGQLLYYDQTPSEPGSGIFSTASSFSEFELRYELSYAAQAISPNGLWIAGFGTPADGDRSVIVQEINGNREFFVVGRSRAERGLYWLNDTEILTILIPWGTRSYRYYPDSILNPFTGEAQVVLPLNVAAGFVPPTPFFRLHYGEEFSISPDGKYSFIYNWSSADGYNIIYDNDTKTVVTRLENMVNIYRTVIWSSFSDRLAFYGFDLSSADHTPNLQIYEITTQTITRISDWREDDWEVYLEVNSWSPDGEYIALGHTDLDTSGSVELLHVPSGDTTAICLKGVHRNNRPFEGFDFAWSRDSRYLALTGVIADDMGDGESEAIYIYDLNEERIYKIPGSETSIIGWASLGISE